MIQEAMASLLHFHVDKRLPSAGFFIVPVMNPILFFPDNASFMALLHEE